MEATLPSFEPDFKNGSKIGFRKWYQHYLFSGKDEYSPMSYDSRFTLAVSMFSDLIDSD